MINSIRAVRRAKRLTLEDVAQRCDPPTTAQTIGRLETGTRTLSLGWMNRIAKALGVDAAELVQLPQDTQLTITALLGADGVEAPTRVEQALTARPGEDMVSVRVTSSIGDYRAGDEIWCRRIEGDWAGALKDAGKAAEVDPANAKAFFRKGTAAGKLGEWDAAIAALKECARLAPADPAARDALAAAKKAAADAKKRNEGMWAGMFKKAAGSMYGDVPAAPPAHEVKEDDLDEEEDATVEKEEAAEAAAAAAAGGGGGGPDETLDGGAEGKAAEAKEEA